MNVRVYIDGNRGAVYIWKEVTLVYVRQRLKVETFGYYVGDVSLY